jgi:hypothetical protein
MAKITAVPTGHDAWAHSNAEDSADAYSTMTEDNADDDRRVSHRPYVTVDDPDDLEDDEIGGAPGSETLLYRISMLRGMIPLSVRLFWQRWYKRATAWGPWLAKKIGNTFWILITSTFLIGFPIFYEGERDKHLRLLEKEQRLMMPGAAPETIGR